MIPDLQTIQNLHKKYASFATAPNLYDLVFEHCQVVCEIALWCAKNSNEAIDVELLQAAALLHDVGTYPFFNEQGETDGSGFYPLHSILGAKLVLDEGYDPRIAKIIETHVLLGLSKEEIADTSVRSWALPVHDYLPTSVEAELLEYADRFHSKMPQFNSFAAFSERLQKFPAQAQKFQALADHFGVPDITALAKKYRHPIV